MMWFEKTFIPFVLSKRVNQAPVLLLVDGHSSYETDEIREIGLANGIIIIGFPSKCTHKLQPLDINVFSSLGRKWVAHCGDRIYQGVGIDRYNMIQEYMSIHNEVFTPDLLHTTFKTIGIYPFNPNVFTKEDFAPPQSSSVVAHAPNSYPCEVMTSPLAPSNASNWDSDLDIDMGQSDSNDNASDPGTSPTHQSPVNWDTDPDDFIDPPSPSLNPMATESRSLSSGHFTCSQKTKFPSPVPISTTLNRSCIPISIAEKDAVICCQDLKINLLENALVQARAKLGASNAHCTLMFRAASEAMASLGTQKCKTCQSVKTKACYITHLALHEQWEVEKREKAHVQKEKTEKEVQKATEDAVCEAQIHSDIALRTFSGALLLCHHFPFTHSSQILCLHTSTRMTFLLFPVHLASKWPKLSPLPSLLQTSRVILLQTQKYSKIPGFLGSFNKAN